MRDVIIEQIERRARLEHDGNFSKAADEYFRDHPDYYRQEDSEVEKRGEDDRKRITAQLKYRTEEIAYREKLDLNKPADLAAAQAKALSDDPDFFKRYKAANTIHVGKVSLITGDE